MTEPKQIKLVRFKNHVEEDIVGYVTHKEGYITVELPLYISIETLFEEGRQILTLQEYLPQAVIELREVDISSEEILFTTPVRDDFIAQFENVSDFFFNNESKIRERETEKTKKRIKRKIPTDFKDDNVISIMEAIIDKKNKPIH